jgi:hypothetical protein
MTTPRFAEDTDNGRFYRRPGGINRVPSITNIKKVKHVPLGGWAAREAATYASKNREMLAGLPEQECFQLVKGSPWQPGAQKDTASWIGDIVHGWLDLVIKGEEVDPMVYTDKNGETHESPTSARSMWRQIVGPGGFIERYKPKWFMSEFTVWSDTYGYAGTADWGGWIGNSLVLVDNKTGAQAWPDTAIQLAALAKADFILDENGDQIDMPKWDKYAVLHIRPRSYTFHPMIHIDEAFQAFLGLKAVFDWQLQFEDESLGWAPKIEVRANA